MISHRSPTTIILSDEWVRIIIPALWPEIPLHNMSMYVKGTMICVTEYPNSSLGEWRVDCGVAEIAKTNAEVFVSKSKINYPISH